jgi:spore coat protein U-like protein
MTGSANKLRYNLYRDALRLNIWGDTTGGTSNLTGSLLLQSPLGTASGVHGVYARIFSFQNAVPGAYADTVVVTVSY